MGLVDCFVSVVVPLSNCGSIINGFLDEVTGILQANYTNYELVLVDDGSSDDTAERVKEALGRHACVRYLRLSRKFGTEIAIASGLESVIGDYTVVMLPECDPPSLIPELVAQARAGQGVVFGVRRNREGDPLWLRLGAFIFYGLARFVFRWRLPRNGTEFRVLSRQVVNAISRIKDRYRYLSLLSFYVGYASQSFVYTPVSRSSRRRRGFFDAVSLAIGMIVAYSTHPLRWVTWVGVGASLLNLLYMSYVVGIYLFMPQVQEGWTTMSLQSSGMFFLLFTLLAVLAEYIGRLVEESSERPLYYVMEERNSNVLVAERRTNVVPESAPLPKVSNG
ncbi:glycosyltransferase family 2 protein [Hyalangium versicolor]|uniref:glycosyltransferase family 2 protein n=1 Tax=Hyalangium versicolor TaxID=2861190 RepID=UPI001CCD02B1|nr:glycosyltransferase family 2 protein [Hyalangium versicolor]